MLNDSADVHRIEGRGRDASLVAAYLADFLARRRRALDAEEAAALRSKDGLDPGKAVQFAMRRLAMNELEADIATAIAQGTIAAKGLEHAQPARRLPLPA